MIRFLQSGNKAAKYLLAGMLGILCLGMVMYLIPGFMNDQGLTRGSMLAAIGGEQITADDVNRETANLQQRQRYPEALLPYVRKQAMDRLVQEAEIRYQGEQMGLRVSDEEVRDELHSGPYSETFFPKGQWIGKDKYEQLLQNNGLTPETFERDVKLQLLARKVMGAVVAGIDVNPNDIEKTYKEQNLKVKFDYALIKMEDVQKQINPTEAELRSFFDTNKMRYQNSIPEKRQVKYFVIGDQQAQNSVTITQADLEKYYKDHQEEFRLPDRVKVRHILISTPQKPDGSKPDQKSIDDARKKAEDILKQIKAGGDFAELAKKNSGDPGSAQAGGEMGWIVKGQTVAEFEKAAFGQNKGQISDPVQSSFGFHIIQTEDKEVAHMQSLAEVKDKIEPLLKEQKVSSALNQMASTAETMARTQSMEKAAAKFNAQVVESNPISRTDALPGIGASPELMTAIFSTTSKAPPTAARGSQEYVVFEVEKTIPPSSPTFEQIKDRVTTDFKTERAGTLLEQKTKELADRAHTSHDLKKAAKELGATVKTSDLVTRTSQVPDLGPMSGAGSAAFGLQQGQISGPLNAGRAGAVLQVIERQEPTLGDEFAKSKDSVREQLVGQKRQEAMQLFLENLDGRLKKEGKLKENKEAIDSLTKLRG
jgi:peptidyl-prolyl cis-trans isomerase D